MELVLETSNNLLSNKDIIVYNSHICFQNIPSFFAQQMGLICKQLNP